MVSCPSSARDADVLPGCVMCSETLLPVDPHRFDPHRFDPSRVFCWLVITRNFSIVEQLDQLIDVTWVTLTPFSAEANRHRPTRQQTQSNPGIFVIGVVACDAAEHSDSSGFLRNYHARISVDRQALARSGLNKESRLAAIVGMILQVCEFFQWTAILCLTSACKKLEQRV